MVDDEFNLQRMAISHPWFGWSRLLNPIDQSTFLHIASGSDYRGHLLSIQIPATLVAQIHFSRTAWRLQKGKKQKV
jgi:hypothetical protein